jgi:predicted regulator of Ras-like GTPase activity (Roadblock/LC7/MglB family)
VTPFSSILRRVVESTPNAIGGAFADPEGEMVDSYAKIDAHEWAVLTAHYGIVLGHLTAAFGTWHFGGPEYFIAQHRKVEIVVYAVDAGYYALMALREPANLGYALQQLRAATVELKREMA